MTEPKHPRQSDRHAMLKTAKLIFSGSVVDCLVMDMSEEGFRVQLGGIMPIPEEVTIQFAGGASFRAIQRWIRGEEIGFAIAGAAQLGAVSRGQAWDVYEAIRGRGLDIPLTRLRELRYFDDPALTSVADAAHAAVAKLEAALRALAQRTS